MSKQKCKTNPMRDFDTLVEALQGLKAEGYQYDFNLISDGLHCKELDLIVGAEDFTVEEIHRFEGDSNPDDSSILYVLSTSKGVKGTMIDAYGTYSGAIDPSILAKLKTPR